MLKSKCFVCKFVPFILSIVIVFSTSVFLFRHKLLMKLYLKMKTVHLYLKM